MNLDPKLLNLLYPIADSLQITLKVRKTTGAQPYVIGGHKPIAFSPVGLEEALELPCVIVTSKVGKDFAYVWVLVHVAGNLYALCYYDDRAKEVSVLLIDKSAVKDVEGAPGLDGLSARELNEVLKVVARGTVGAFYRSVKETQWRKLDGTTDMGAAGSKPEKGAGTTDTGCGDTKSGSEACAGGVAGVQGG